MANNLPAEQDDEPKKSIVQRNAEVVLASERIIRFRGRALIMVYNGFAHYVLLKKETFEQIAYPLLGGVTRSRISDVMAYAINAAEDLTGWGDMVLFGKTDWDADEDPTDIKPPVVWDMAELAPVMVAPLNTIWRSPYKPIVNDEHLPFILSLAGGDMGLYDDIMQSIAPLIMDKKPDGVIWWVGDGANGKSTLMDALYRIFPGQFASINVKQLTDGRDTPGLNGVMANVVRESSEGRIDDTQIYKSIGTHEDFQVHKFHSQDSVTIRGNLHHIFSGNSIPVFNDKGHSARRRTYIVPFTQTFESDPSFEEATFTTDFFGKLIWEMMKYAIKLQGQGYKYKWSAATLGAKTEYDDSANSAETYARELIAQGVVAFNSFNPIRVDYEGWCMDEGVVPLGINNLTRALKTVGYERMSVNSGNGKITKHYRLPSIGADDLLAISPAKPGMFTARGFMPDTTTTTTTTTADKPEQQELGKKYKW